MLIGDPTKFAIRYELDQHHGDKWMFGRVSFVINGIEVGDYSLGTSLRDVLFIFEQLLKSRNQRRDDKKYSMNPIELYGMLDDGLFGNESSEFAETAFREAWGRFYITPSLDVFNGWKIFIVENAYNGRIIFSHNFDQLHGMIDEVIINSGDFDHVLTQAIIGLQKIYDAALQNQNDTEL